MCIQLHILVMCNTPRVVVQCNVVEADVDRHVLWKFSEAVASRLSGRDHFDDYSIQTAAESVLEAHFPPQEKQYLCWLRRRKTQLRSSNYRSCFEQPCFEGKKGVWR
jgi:hypothetical protein